MCLSVSMEKVKETKRQKFLILVNFNQHQFVLEPHLKLAGNSLTELGELPESCQVRIAIMNCHNLCIFHILFVDTVFWYEADGVIHLKVWLDCNSATSISNTACP